MARINGSVSQRADSYSFYIEWSESKASDYISTNKTTVTATAYIYCSAHSAWANGLAQKLVIDGTEFTDTISVDLSSGVTVTLISGSKTITHNSDGSKSITISADCDLPDGDGWGPAWGSASGTATLTTIPRYATSVQSLNTKTINSIKMNWSSDSTIDYVWYSKDNGSTWTAVGSVNAKSGNYTITGLSANTTYNIKTRVRRKDSQLTTDSSKLAVTTYNKATISSAPNFNHGSNETNTYSNPSGQAMAIGIFNTAGSVAYAAYRTCTGTSYTFNFTDAELDALYKAYGTNSSFTVRIYLRTTCNGSYYYSYKDVTITLKGNQKTVHFKVSGTWRRCKVYIKVSGTWRPAVLWEKISGTWRRVI